jgi:hypothetical protein
MSPCAGEEVRWADERASEARKTSRVHLGAGHVHAQVLRTPGTRPDAGERKRKFKNAAARKEIGQSAFQKQSGTGRTAHAYTTLEDTMGPHSRRLSSLSYRVWAAKEEYVKRR